MILSGNDHPHLLMLMVDGNAMNIPLDVPLAEDSNVESSFICCLRSFLRVLTFH